MIQVIREQDWELMIAVTICVLRIPFSFIVQFDLSLQALLRVLVFLLSVICLSLASVASKSLDATDLDSPAQLV